MSEQSVELRDAGDGMVTIHRGDGKHLVSNGIQRPWSWETSGTAVRINSPLARELCVANGLTIIEPKEQVREDEPCGVLVGGQPGGFDSAIAGLQSFHDKLKAGVPIEATQVTRYDTPDGPMYERKPVVIGALSEQVREELSESDKADLFDLALDAARLLKKGDWKELEATLQLFTAIIRGDREDATLRPLDDDSPPCQHCGGTRWTTMDHGNGATSKFPCDVCSPIRWPFTGDDVSVEQITIVSDASPSPSEGIKRWEQMANEIVENVQREHGQEVWITDGHAAGGDLREAIASALSRLASDHASSIRERDDTFEAMKSTCEEWQRLAESRGRIIDKRDGQIATLKRELAQAERDDEQTAHERDEAQEALSKAHVALGGDGEWVAKTYATHPPDTGDLHLDVPALAEQVKAERDAANERLAQLQRDHAAEVERLTRERDMAIREATRRDEKWMDGINASVGEKLNFDAVNGNAQLTLDKWANDLKAERDAALSAKEVAEGERDEARRRAEIAEGDAGDARRHDQQTRERHEAAVERSRLLCGQRDALQQQNSAVRGGILNISLLMEYIIKVAPPCECAPPWVCDGCHIQMFLDGFREVLSLLSNQSVQEQK